MFTSPLGNVIVWTVIPGTGAHVDRKFRLDLELCEATQSGRQLHALICAPVTARRALGKRSSIQGPIDAGA